MANFNITVSENVTSVQVGDNTLVAANSAASAAASATAASGFADDAAGLAVSTSRAVAKSIIQDDAAGRAARRRARDEFYRAEALARLRSPLTRSVWYVDPSAVGTADGSSEANAFTTLQAAAAAASAGDKIIVNAAFATPLAQEQVTPSLSNIEIDFAGGSDGVTWIDGRNFGTWTDEGGGVFSITATQPEFVAYDLKQDDAAGTVTGIDWTEPKRAAMLEEQGLTAAQAAAWYGFVEPSATLATTTPAEGEWGYTGGKIYINPPGSPVLATVNTLACWSDGDGPLYFSATMTDCYLHGDLRCLFSPATSGPNGYIRFASARNTTIADVIVYLGGYHAIGMAAGSRDGNRMINCASLGHTTDTGPAFTANPFVFYADSDRPKAGHRGQGLFFGAYPLLRGDGAPLLSERAFTPLLGYSHTNGSGNEIGDIKWLDCLQCDFHEMLKAKHTITMTYTSTANRSIANANNTLPSILSPTPFPVVAEDCYFLGVAAMHGRNTEFINCRVDREGDGSASEILNALSTASGTYKIRIRGGYFYTGECAGLFGAMTDDNVLLDSVHIHQQAAGDNYVFFITGTGGHCYIKGCAFQVTSANASVLQVANTIWTGVGYPAVVTNLGGNVYDDNFTDRVARAANSATGKDTIDEWLANTDTGNLDFKDWPAV